MKPSTNWWKWELKLYQIIVKKTSLTYTGPPGRGCPPPGSPRRSLRCRWRGRPRSWRRAAVWGLKCWPPSGLPWALSTWLRGVGSPWRSRRGRPRPPPPPSPGGCRPSPRPAPWRPRSTESPQAAPRGSTQQCSNSYLNIIYIISGQNIFQIVFIIFRIFKHT